MKTKQANGARTYLHVMPRYAAEPRWHVYQISDQSPRITFAESVTCYVDAHKLAAREQRRSGSLSRHGSRCSTPESPPRQNPTTSLSSKRATATVRAARGARGR